MPERKIRLLGVYRLCRVFPSHISIWAKLIFSCREVIAVWSYYSCGATSRGCIYTDPAKQSLISLRQTYAYSPVGCIIRLVSFEQSFYFACGEISIHYSLTSNTFRGFEPRGMGVLVLIQFDPKFADYPRTRTYVHNPVHQPRYRL